jgi:hypothetical protein
MPVRLGDGAGAAPRIAHVGRLEHLAEAVDELASRGAAVGDGEHHVAEGVHEPVYLRVAGVMGDEIGEHHLVVVLDEGVTRSHQLGKEAPGPRRPVPLHSQVEGHAGPGGERADVQRLGIGAQPPLLHVVDHGRRVVLDELKRLAHLPGDAPQRPLVADREDVGEVVHHDAVPLGGRAPAPDKGVALEGLDGVTRLRQQGGATQASHARPDGHDF